MRRSGRAPAAGAPRSVPSPATDATIVAAKRVGVVERWQEPADRAGPGASFPVPRGARPGSRPWPAGEGDLEGPTCLELAADLGQVRWSDSGGRETRAARGDPGRPGSSSMDGGLVAVRAGPARPRGGRRSRRPAPAAADRVGRLAERPDPDDVDVPSTSAGLGPPSRPERGLGRRPRPAERGRSSAAGRGRPRPRRRGESSPIRGDPAGGPPVTCSEPRRIPIAIARSSERAGPLAQVGRSQVDRDPPRRMAEPGVAGWRRGTRFGAPPGSAASARADRS